MSSKVRIVDGVDVHEGDCIIVINQDGSIGEVILPEHNNTSPETKGYKLTLDVLEFLLKVKGATIRSKTETKKYN